VIAAINQLISLPFVRASRHSSDSDCSRKIRREQLNLTEL